MTILRLSKRSTVFFAAVIRRAARLSVRGVPQVGFHRLGSACAVCAVCAVCALHGSLWAIAVLDGVNRIDAVRWTLRTVVRL
jgi:hypothetical protein